MKLLDNQILMVTPFDKAQRGNNLTTARLQAGLTARGFNIGRISLEDPNWLRHLELALTQSKYSLVHGFHALHLSRMIQTLPSICRLPIILTTTGTDINHDLWGLEREKVLSALNRAGKVVIYHEDFRNCLQEALPELQDKLVTIPQGIWLPPGKPQTRQELGLSTQDCIFLLPSGIRPVKNLELAVEGLSLLYNNNPTIRLLIIGAVIDSTYGQYFLNHISNLPWVTYLGEFPHNEMESILAIGDVVINSSLSEGQPQAAMEAMSLSKPGLLTAVPGNQNLITHGKEGFYFNDAWELYQVASQLAEDKPLREAMGLKAQQLMRTHFDLKQEIDAYEQLYRNAFKKTDFIM